MDHNPVILEISSDEEGGLDEVIDDNLDWISELLYPVGNVTEESDDVVVVGEFRASSVFQKQNYKPPDTAKLKDDSDDECMILDGDPDNPVAVVNDTEDGSEELLIVGEKGQLACRDYPHPRHLCAKFPFSSTPHEKYCDLCHCYVCEIHAPCASWGYGLSSTDHCHATDKEQIWRVKRKHLKQGNTVPPPVPKLPNTALSMMLPSSNTVQTPNQLVPPNQGFVPIHSSSNSAQPHACSSASNFGMSNIISPRSSNRRAGVIQHRNRLSPHLSRSQLMPVMNNLIQKETSGRSGTSVPRFVPYHTKSKRAGTTGCGLLHNLHGPGNGFPSNSNNLVSKSQQPRSYAPHEGCKTSWQDFLTVNNLELESCQSSSQTSMGSNFAYFQSYTISSQPQSCSQPTLQLSESHNTILQANPSPNATNLNPLDLIFREINNTTESIQLPPEADSNFQSVKPSFDYSFPITESNPPYTSSTNSVPSDFCMENWPYPDHQSVMGTTKDCVPYEPDIVLPESSSVDPAMVVFDFETSWNEVPQEPGVSI
uniref:RPM1 interacting protein 13 n=1 Tax=Nelumbo nucifera TaxID=4432 RepID=A0A822Z081_NELNU|nr:TPA_asm: hypothetical protein HUJ06_007550 [Nelumbo nucifera]